MSSGVFETLRKAIETHHCVTMYAEGRRRQVAPLAIGYKGAQRKVLTFQYRGDSNSGLVAGGFWRCFAIDDIAWAAITDDPWQCGTYPVAKTESSFDYVVCGVGARLRTYEHRKKGR